MWLYIPGPYSNGNPEMVLKRHKTRIRAHHLKGNKSVGDNSELDDAKGEIVWWITKAPYKHA